MRIWKRKTRILLTNHVRAKFGVVDWDNLPLNVREVLVDLTYRGDNKRTREGFVPALVNFDGDSFVDVMDSENRLWADVDSITGEKIVKTICKSICCSLFIFMCSGAVVAKKSPQADNLRELKAVTLSKMVSEDD